MNEVAQSVPDQVLLTQYGCGPIRFSGQDDALYERHLLFDDVVAPEAAGPREPSRQPHVRCGMCCRNAGY